MSRSCFEAGLSQVEFGERCGFYQTYLSRLERGQANPTLNAMEVIANGLGLTAAPHRSCSRSSHCNKRWLARRKHLVVLSRRYPTGGRHQGFRSERGGLLSRLPSPSPQERCSLDEIRDIAADQLRRPLRFAASIG
ncbi:MAG: helix-turn-helix transcriptional regulator [Telluria sp.]|nr:helix-turn-helix transcriptional regulator [Telluria sp.]